MGYSVDDHITEWLDGEGWFYFDPDYIGTDKNPWDPYGESDNTPQNAYEPPAWDPEKVALEIMAYHERAVEHCKYGPYSYYVNPDTGLWHHDKAQLYAMLEKDPYLKPEEWLARAPSKDE